MNKYIFKPRAQLLLQLGEQLIKNESVALIELIKNAYDADATYVNITMNDINTSIFGEIQIKDNGFGMTKETVENIWLEPGNTHKKEMIERNVKTPKGRLPIGEKGIGRFGVHKLGRDITVVTRAENNKEVVVELDWDNFVDAKYLNDVNIIVYEREPEIFKLNSTGTLIIIKKLQTDWKLLSFKQVCRAINNLNSPFKNMTDFQVDLNCNIDGWKNELIDFEDIKKYSLFNFNANIDEKGYIEYTYNFTPFDAMKNIDKKTISNSELLSDNNHTPLIELDVNDKPSMKIGDISITIYAFDRDTDIINNYIITDKKSFKSYLDDNGGIYVFRDGMRIYDYGEKENDWLQLDSKRVNSPGARLSNNIVIGAIYLKRSESLDLIEKSNREGFIENDAYIKLKEIINRTLEIFVSFRNSDKENIRTIKNVKEPVLTNLRILNETVKKSSATENEKKEICKYIETIDKEYNYLKDITLTTASAGLSYGVVIHEVEKIIKELSVEVIENVDISIMREKILHLSDIIENYSNLLKGRKKVTSSLLSMVKQAKYNCEYRFKSHNIECYIDEESFGNFTFNCTHNLIISSIMNLFDNSIWWIDYAKKETKKIKVCLSNYYKGYKTILVIDNGNGFTVHPEDAIKPFVSKKPNGMGLGLNIVNEIMITNNGELVFPNVEDLNKDDISKIEPKAIIGLAFKEEKYNSYE